MERVVNFQQGSIKTDKLFILNLKSDRKRRREGSIRFTF